MKSNELLLWLSARVQGSWEQFKAAVEELQLSDDERVRISQQGGLPIHQTLRLALERLGHVEFFTKGCESGWRVAPPVWAAFEARGLFSAALCGARTAEQLQRIATSISAPVSLRLEDDIDAPTTYRLTSSDRASLLSNAAATCIPIQHETPRAILSALGSVSSEIKTIAEFPIGNWIVEKFSAETLHWAMSTREEAVGRRNGLFRFRLPYQRRHFLRRHRKIFEMDGATAKYSFLRWRYRVLHFDTKEDRLIVPASCRPPLLVERALVLCSGRLPMFNADNATLEYRSVSREVAGLAANLLEQELLE